MQPLAELRVGPEGHVAPVRDRLSLLFLQRLFVVVEGAERQNAELQRVPVRALYHSQTCPELFLGEMLQHASVHATLPADRNSMPAVWRPTITNSPEIVVVLSES